MPCYYYSLSNQGELNAFCFWICLVKRLRLLNEESINIGVTRSPKVRIGNPKSWKVPSSCCNRRTGTDGISHRYLLHSIIFLGLNSLFLLNLSRRHVFPQNFAGTIKMGSQDKVKIEISLFQLHSIFSMFDLQGCILFPIFCFYTCLLIYHCYSRSFSIFPNFIQFSEVCCIFWQTTTLTFWIMRLRSVFWIPIFCG